jgi:mRNA interferase MazF
VAKNRGKSDIYFPERGDIIWMNLDPSQGNEIKKARPALVISPLKYNEKTGLALLCPITSHVKGYPFEVCLPPSGTIKGAILSDHIKSLDWRVRKAKFIEKTSPQVIGEVTEKLFLLIDTL